MEELELVVQNLETAFKEQQQECYRTSQNAVQSVSDVQKTIDLIRKQVGQRNAIFRKCRELHQTDPSLNSGMYWIDPDGQGIGDDPIYVECDMTTGSCNYIVCIIPASLLFFILFRKNGCPSR